MAGDGLTARPPIHLKRVVPSFARMDRAYNAGPRFARMATRRSVLQYRSELRSDGHSEIGSTTQVRASLGGTGREARPTTQVRASLGWPLGDRFYNTGPSFARMDRPGGPSYNAGPSFAWMATRRSVLQRRSELRSDGPAGRPVLQHRSELRSVGPAGGPAADQGVRPTKSKIRFVSSCTRTQVRASLGWQAEACPTKTGRLGGLVR